MTIYISGFLQFNLESKTGKFPQKQKKEFYLHQKISDVIQLITLNKTLITETKRFHKIFSIILF